jgi:hypothetical protein
MCQGLLFQLGDKLFIVGHIPPAIRISLLKCALPVAKRSNRFSEICADRPKLSVTCKTAPNLEFALREASHY